MLDQNISEINHNASPFTPALKYGVIRGLIAVILTLVLYLSGLYQSTIDGSSPSLAYLITFVGIGLTVLSVVLAVNEHKANRGGYISLGQGLGVGMLTALIYGVIAAIWSYVFINFIVTGYEEMMMDGMIAQWEAADMSDQEIETAIEFAGSMTSPVFMMVGSLIAPLFTGFFAGLITGAVVQTRETK